LSPKILIVRLGALGDIVHGLPVAAALGEHLPGARIDWLVDDAHAALLEFVPAINRRVAVEGRSAAGVIGTIRALRQERYDVAIDLQGLLKSAVFARLSGAARVIGFDRAHVRERAASAFYTERVDPGGATHVIDKNLALLSALGIDDRARRFPFAVPASTASRLAAEWTAREGRAGFALFNAGAGWPNKQWPPERFGETAAWLAATYNLLPVVVWGPREPGLAGRVVAAAGGAARLAPPTGVGDLLALSRGARLMLSGDTGPMHLAAGLGTSVVALFGPTDPARNGPWGERDISLSRHDECVCRYERRCRRARPCIEDIPVEAVCEAIARRLGAESSHG
jgi:lipopolysaccharide heptosyltransferase I